jgi:hypothetical protein
MAGVGQDVGIAGRPGPSVQEVLSQETRSVPVALRQEFNDSRGTEDLDKERYYAREFYRLIGKIIPRVKWRVAIEAFLEALHIPTKHPQVMASTSDLNSQYDLRQDRPHYSRLLFLSGVPSPPPAPMPLLGPDETFADAKELGDLGPFFNQDLGNMEWVQKGLRATRKPGVTLARYQESQIRHFHRTLDMYLYGENGRR